MHRRCSPPVDSDPLSNVHNGPLNLGARAGQPWQTFPLLSLKTQLHNLLSSLILLIILKWAVTVQCTASSLASCWCKNLFPDQAWWLKFDKSQIFACSSAHPEHSREIIVWQMVVWCVPVAERVCGSASVATVCHTVPQYARGNGYVADARLGSLRSTLTLPLFYQL